jgi:peptide deformylase
MAVLPIITAPDPRLKLQCEPVESVDAAIAKMMDDMLDTMYVAPGIGLAAPQVGIAKRILVVDLSPKDGPREPIRMANPEILWHSDDLATYEEGCLSLPEQYADVERPAHVKVRYLDQDNTAQELEADGLLATCIQHEMDHLDGVIFVDHISSLKRRMILRKLTKLKKQEALAGD